MTKKPPTPPPPPPGRQLNNPTPGTRPSRPARPVPAPKPKK